MTPEKWRKVEELLNAALEIEPTNRRAFLEKIGGEDLRCEVESLLASEITADGFLTCGAMALAADLFDKDEAADALVGQNIGNYKIVGELGRGGMGAVYLAQRDDGKFQQKVAVKLLKSELNTADIRRRFHREQQILAALTHPNIAHLLDAGTTAEGLPFLVMEYIEGLPIDEFCKRESLDLNKRLEIFRTVCEAVSFAHRNLIVHRDLKPSNILITKDRIPKLLDFGISKLLTPEFENESAHTITNLGVMTPAYASPEQLRKESVTTATDIYSLGVVLYELLSGHRPFYDKEINLGEIYKAVIDTDPLPPSAMIETAAKSFASNVNAPTEALSAKNHAPPHNPGKTKRSNNFRRTASQTVGIKSQVLRGDLDNIILKALKKEPSRRYSSVEQFSEDVRRYLADLPVLARPDTLSYRATKFVNRNRVVVIAGLLIFFTLIGGIFATLWQARRAEANQIRAEKRFADVRGLSNALLNDIAPKIERVPGSTEARQALINQSLKYLDSLANEAQGDLMLQSELAAAYEKIGDLEGNPANPNFIDSEAALKNYEKAQAIRLKLLENNPNDFEQQRSLAENYRVRGKIYGQANDFQFETENLEMALQIFENLLAKNPESDELKFAVAQTNYDIGRNRSSGRGYSESFLYFERAITALENLRAENPHQSDVIKLLGACRTDFSNTLSWDGKQPEAEAEAARAIELLEKAVAANPNDVNLRTGLWFAYWLTSSTYEEQDDRLAHEYAAKALNVIDEIVRQDGANIRARQLLSKSLSTLGQSLINTGKPREAILYLEKARQVSQEIIESRTKNNGLRHDYAAILMRLGEAHFKQEKLANALSHFEQAADIQQEILQNLPDDARTRRNLAVTYESIAETHGKISGEKSSAALENYQKVLDILLQLESQNALGEFDRKFFEKTKRTIQNYNK